VDASGEHGDVKIVEIVDILAKGLGFLVGQINDLLGSFDASFGNGGFGELRSRADDAFVD
jgi:hypothetical protein